MRRRAIRGIACILAVGVAFTWTPRTAHAQDDPWASHRGSILIQPSEPLNWYSRRKLGQRSALENYWESQRQAQLVSAQERGPAQFGFYNGYYYQQTSVRVVAPIPSDPLGYGPYVDDLYYERKYDLVDPIDFDDLCSNHSSIDCLDDLHRTGRR
jgi:hypothetical protein